MTAAAQDEPTIIFNSDEIHAKPNEKVELDCGINGTYRYCIWEHGGDVFQTEDIHDGVYEGWSQPETLEENQCGIVLDSASTENHGEWTCKIFIKGGSLMGSKNITIPVKPTQAKITPAELIANADEETKIECSVMAARPAVELKWLLNDEDITEQSVAEDSPVTGDGTFMTVSTLKRNFTAAENEKELKCVVDHQTLEESEITLLPVKVVYAPVEKVPQTFYELSEGDDYEIRVKFSANPKPSKILWQFGESFDDLVEDVEIPFAGPKMMTKLEPWVNEKFVAVLKISSLTEEDFQRKYNLFVENEVGSTNYQVMLSKDYIPSPTTEATKTDDGEDNNTIIIAAVVSILVVVVLVALIATLVKMGPKWFSCRKGQEEETKSDAEKGEDVASNGIKDEESKLIEKTELTEKEEKNANEENGDVKKDLVEGETVLDENSKEVSDKNEKNGHI